MPQKAESYSFTEAEVRSWGDPKSWAQGKSLGVLTNDLMAKLLALAIIEHFAISDNKELWNAVLQTMEDQTSAYDGDGKFLYLDFSSGTVNGGIFGATAANVAQANVTLFERSWTAAVMWR